MFMQYTTIVISLLLGTAILVSYIWGTAVFGETPKIVALSVVGVFVLIGSVFCIAFNQQLTARLFPAQYSENRDLTISLTGDIDTTGSQGQNNFALGVFWAVVTGAFGGSILVPLNYAPPEASGFAFLPSFGIGTMIAAPVVAAAWFAREGAIPESHWRVTLPIGIISGTLWNISNVLAIVAIPQLGYAVAYPILQCALFVAGIWGIVIFDEIKGKEILVFFCSGIVLLAGAISIALAS
jgi:hypothetical protein